MWLGVTLKTDFKIHIKTTCIGKRLDYVVQILLFLPNIIVNIFGERGVVQSFYNIENLHIDDRQDIHMSSIFTREVVTCTMWICSSLALIVCFMSYEKWV